MTTFSAVGDLAEGEARDQERDAEAGTVDREQEGAVEGADEEVPVALMIAPSVGPVQGVQAIAKATPVSTGPERPARCISDWTCHSRASLRDQRTEHEQQAHHDDERAADVLRGAAGERASQRLLAEQPERDEDRAEAADEREARADHAAGLDLGRVRDAGDRRDVARDERQHAGREEADQTGAEGDRDADA